MGRAEQSPGAWQLAGALTATPTVVSAPEVPPGPQWLMDFVAGGAFATLCVCKDIRHKDRVRAAGGLFYP